LGGAIASFPSLGGAIASSPLFRDAIAPSPFVGGVIASVPSLGDVIVPFSHRGGAIAPSPFVGGAIAYFPSLGDDIAPFPSFVMPSPLHLLWLVPSPISPIVVVSSLIVVEVKPPALDATAALYSPSASCGSAGLRPPLATWCCRCIQEGPLKEI
jgi:hypothetical protein